jgi:hypothetical protein
MLPPELDHRTSTSALCGAQALDQRGAVRDEGRIARAARAVDPLYLDRDLLAEVRPPLPGQ